MKFKSLKNTSLKSSFNDAVITGLASDGGLYFPCDMPCFNQNELNELRNKQLNEVAYLVLRKWLADDFSDIDIKEIAENAFDFEIPLRKVGNYYVLELFHGPTMAFKDVGVKTLAQIMKQILKKNSKKVTVLVATSGDTGGAVAQGFGGVDNMQVVVLFPKGKISRLQEEQLTRVKNNVFSMEVEGVFDDCQDLVKKALVDKELVRFNFTSANSINVGRLIPQIVYYAYVFSRLNKNNLEFIVPSGNTGNLTAGIMAKKMNIPVSSLVAACNANDTVVDYSKTGVYEPKKTISTLSNAMDIGAPNNFPRILELFNNNHGSFKELVKAVNINDEATIETMKKVYEKYNYLLDPHTAVAWSAAEKKADKDKTAIILSTASPVKFSKEIEVKTGIKIDDSVEMKKLQQIPKRKYALNNDYGEFKKFIKNYLN